MGNEMSSGAGPGDSAVRKVACPGTFPIGIDADHATPSEQQGAKRKRSSQSTQPNHAHQSTPSHHHVDKKPFQQHHDPSLQEDPEKELTFVSPSSTIRASDAWKVLEEGVSLETDLQWICLLGESTEGRVYKAKSKSGSVYALKILKEKATSRYAAHLPSECLLHLKIPIHPNILFLSQIDITANSEILMCTTFANAGSLFNQIKRFERLDMHAPALFALHVFIQISEALAYLHSGYRRMGHGDWRKDDDFTPIIHGDIKPDNVLQHVGDFDVCGMPLLRLCDFGHCTVASSPMRVSGSPLYFCPEAKAASRGDFSGPRMSPASDVYCLALTLFFLLTYGHWRTGTNPSVLTLRPTFDDLGFTGILKQCLAVKPNHRPSMNLHLGTGLLRCVDDAWTLRDKIFKEQGPLSSKLWNNGGD